jgi:hypothetical protein
MNMKILCDLNVNLRIQTKIPPPTNDYPKRPNIQNSLRPVHSMKMKFGGIWKIQITRKGYILVDRRCSHLPERHVLGTKPSLALSAISLRT